MLGGAHTCMCNGAGAPLPVAPSWRSACVCVARLCPSVATRVQCAVERFELLQDALLRQLQDSYYK